jgi:hypothetical protein
MNRFNLYIFLLFTFLILNGCVYSGSSISDKASLYIDAVQSKDNVRLRTHVSSISAGHSITKTFCLLSSNRDLYIFDKSWKLDEYASYPEVLPLLKNELVKNGYTQVTLGDKKCVQRINIAYGYRVPNGDTDGLEKHVITKYLSIDSFDQNTVPLWKAYLSMYDNDMEIRIHLPALIKCITPYLNKNFNGIVTCK